MKQYCKTYRYQLMVLALVVGAAMFSLFPADGAAMSALPLIGLATFNLATTKNQVDQNRQQSTRRVELPYRVDFSTLGDATGLVADEDAEVLTLPAGFVFERLDAVLRVAEGEAATCHVGINGTPTRYATSLNLNGTPNAMIAQAPTAVAVATADADATYGQPEADLINEIKGDVNTLVSNLNAYVAKERIYHHANQNVIVTCPNGANTINVAVVDLIFVGYMIDTGNEK